MKPFSENDLRVLRARWGGTGPAGVPRETVVLVRRLLATIERQRAESEALFEDPAAVLVAKIMAEEF